jgi:predicted porin
MKKSLIALAALAAVSAASAQSTVTLSGAVGFGYTKDATTKGYEMTDGKFTLAAKEDLGGGLSAAASMTVDSVFGRQTTSPTNADTTLTVASKDWSLTMGSFESTADARKGDVSGLSMEQGMDKANYNLATVPVDAIVGTLTVMPGVSVGIAHAEYGTLGDATTATKLTKLIASYANGPLSLYGSNTNTNVAGAKSYSDIAASYNMGVAKVGVGHRTKGDALTSTNLVSLSVPVGALSFGIVSVTYNGLSATGYGVNYSLSKRTNLYLANGVSDVASLDKSTRLKLVHAF